MTDVQARLQQAIGDAYRIERELARGGMSRLFLATEASLHRRVVVKLLPPELANEVSEARFRQEAELAAGLQHPHVLPILGAGARDGLLYYIMPYVEGESLRHRLEREGRLAVTEAVTLLSEVADALAYAHSRGIVHRDIKPENILLEQGHAVLSDFGVARALAESSSGRLTATGTSVGTPAYMSPEQLAAEPNIDARADLYALGVVGYEILTGTLPFQGPTAQAVITAALTAAPKPVQSIRAEVPARVSAAIATALAKNPDERFPSAGVFRAALGPVPDQAPGRGRRLAAAGGAVVVLLAVALLLARARAGREVALNPDLLAVAPFSVVGNADIGLWGEGLADIVSRQLDGAGVLRTLPASVTVKQWSGGADPAVAAALGRRTGSGLVVYGSILGLGPDSARLTASLYDVERGRALGSDIELRAPRDRMDRLADSLSLRVLAQLGRVRPVGAARLQSIGSRSPAAVKSFLRAEQLSRRASWDSAIAHYQEAVAADSTFALAWWRMGDAIAWSSTVQAGITSRDARFRAAALNHGLAPRDSLLIVIDSLFPTILAADSLAEQRQRRYWRALEQAVGRYPQDPQVWYKYGDGLLHLGWQSGRRPDSAQAAFERAITLDSTHPDALEHARLMAFHLDGPERARRFVDAMRALNPVGETGKVMAIEAAILDSGLTPDAVASRVAGLDRGAIADLRADLGRSPDFPEHGLKVLEAASEQDPRSWKVWYAFHLMFLGRYAEARKHPDEAPQANEVAMIMASDLGALPAESLGALFDRRLEEAARDSTQLGPAPPLVLSLALRGDSARVSRYLRYVDAQYRRAGSPPPAVAQVRSARERLVRALARGDTSGVIRTIGEIPRQRRDQGLVLLQARLLAATGRPAAAADSLEVLGLSMQNAYFPDLLDVMLVMERARLHRQNGSREKALRDFNYVRKIWAGADSLLQPLVREADDAVRALSAERGT